MSYFEAYTTEKMRKAMREIMRDEYIAGSNANDEAWKYAEANRD